MGKSYYRQVFLEECKYVVKEKKYIIDDIEISSDSDRENSDEENQNLIKIFFVYIKMVNMYYQTHKERLRKETRERYQNFSEEEKDKRQKKA